MTRGAMEIGSKGKNEAKLTSSRSGISTSADGTSLIIRVGGNETEIEKDTERPAEEEIEVQMASINESNNTNNDANKKDNFGKTFSSSAKDALQKAMSLAKAKNSTQGSASSETSEEPKISIEDLRDLINQNPGEFWQSNEGEEPKANSDLVFEKDETIIRKAYTQSNFRAKRRKIQQRNIENSTYPANKKDKKEGPSLEDIETLGAVRTLLEESLDQLPSNKSSDLAKGILEHLKSIDSDDNNSMELDQQEFLARKVTASFAKDLSEIFKAIKASDDSTQNDDSSNKEKLPPKQPIVDSSLLCDEEDIEQLRDDNGEARMELEDDDDIVEISQDENYVQQVLMCHEETELFGKPTTEDNQQNVSDRLVAQKVALLRETNRLIRSKALVLTKRRLAIQDEDDLSVVI